MAKEIGLNKTYKPSEDNTKTEYKIKFYEPICCLLGPGHNKNLCKVIREGAISMKVIWFSNSGGWVVHIKFAGIKKCFSDGKELNMLPSSYVAKAIKVNKKYRDKATYNSDLEDELEHLKFKRIDIWLEYESLLKHGHKER